MSTKDIEPLALNATRSSMSIMPLSDDTTMQDAPAKKGVQRKQKKDQAKKKEKKSSTPKARKDTVKISKRLENKDKHTFMIRSGFSPRGSQPEAIKKLVEGIKNNQRFQTLLGVTGSGKTFTMANVIQKVQKPTIVLVHNKTLAAQLYQEFKEFFPKNRVEYFVSYYDYYQPESYIPSKDQYIEKDADINPKIEQMRLSATASILSRRDVIVVASVSCIYSLGNPANYKDLGFEVSTGQKIRRDGLLRKLIDILYERNDTELMPGRFRVRGDVVDLIPAEYDNVIRIEFFGDEIERIIELEKVSLEPVETYDYFYVFPARHFVMTEDEKRDALRSIGEELTRRLPQLEAIEAHRLKQRTQYDMEMIEETGFCKGIENYSRHFDGRTKGQRPYCLLDYFGDDFLFIIDESHQSLPQVRGMYNGDLARKQTLVDYGFRLPSALDNRPLRFNEFETFLKQVVFVSATPGEYEQKHSSQIVEQIIRPTGLVDPAVETRPSHQQIPDLKEEILAAVGKGHRVLVTTLTKKLAEELSEYLGEQGIKTRYLHSEIDTLERTELIRLLRLGECDVLVGINLLREGLDIPEVGLIAIMDADKEGFLRDYKSLIQIIGRAARNVDSKVILYADKLTDSIRRAVDETDRRRAIQIQHNMKHKIVPATIIKPIKEKVIEMRDIKSIPRSDIPALIKDLEEEMRKAADELDFEKAIFLRDKVNNLKRRKAAQ